MPRRALTARRTPSQAAADRRADELTARLGRALREAREARGLTQAAVAERAGLTRSTLSRLETQGNGRFTFATLERLAMAVDSELRAYLEALTFARQPKDAVHLRHQEVLIRTARGGGWRAVPESPIDREARTSRAADVLLERSGEWALMEVWDWFEDVGAALRDWDRRLAAVERLAIAQMPPDPTDGTPELPNIGGCWVVRATRRNRELVRSHAAVFRSRFAGSGQVWVRALTTTQAMPASPALLWVSVDGTRVFPARLEVD